MERKEFKNSLRELVEIPTVSEKNNLKESAMALDLVESWADSSVSRKRVKNGKAEILLLGNGNLINPDIGYLVHIDVVDGDPGLFKMKEKKGKFYGRGVSDMKYSIPIGIKILNTLANSNSTTSMTVAITTDEEVGGGKGGAHLARAMKFRPKVLIVPDGGDNFVFVNKSKGVAHIWVESKGVATHASTPWLGKNAIVPLVSLSNRLVETYEKNSVKQNWKTTMNIGVLQGGKSTNQVCGEAILKLDFRFPESRSARELSNEVKSLAVKIDKNLKVKVAASGDATSTDVKNPEISRFLKIAKEVLREDVVIRGEEGASDARYWARYNIPIIMIKPKGGGIHGKKEWIDADSCLTFYKILSRYINEFNT